MKAVPVHDVVPTVTSTHDVEPLVFTIS